MNLSYSLPTPSRVRLLVLALIALLAATAVLVPAQGEARSSKKPAEITVMSRNLYLGADLTPAIEATSVCAAIDAGGAILNEVDATDFPARAKLLAKEIDKADPDLVGLQEVALWREQPTSDFTTTDAEDVRYDFLKILEKELKKQKADFDVAIVQEEFDQELPADTDGNDASGNGPFASCGADIDARLTMHDAILVNKDSRVSVKKPDSGQFEKLFEVDLAGILPIDVERGWVSVDAKVKGSKRMESAKLHFVNTHLEAFGDPEIREAQARELFAKGGPLRTNRQLVFLGDINSGGRKDRVGKPFTDPKDPLAYDALVDEFNLTNLGARQSCCFKTVIADQIGSSKLDHTVDHVMVKPQIRQKDAFITGSDPDVTRSGVIASDHGGVVSTLRLK